MSTQIVRLVLIACLLPLALAGCDDGGGNSDPAPQDSLTQCTPDCFGKDCGDDGCGGVCGSCFTLEGSVDESLCQDGKCACVPNCFGKNCGDDGCGGKCGTCFSPEGWVAPELCDNGVCCVPNCNGKSCGDSDGCGGKCQGCPDGCECKYNSCDCPTCIGYSGDYPACCSIDDPCDWTHDYPGDCICDGFCPWEPAGCGGCTCAGKECGDDGCGVSCGTCSGGTKCNNGQCITVGSGKVCEPCAEASDCKAGYACYHWKAQPDVTFCASPCDHDDDCPWGYQMYCSKDGYCLPKKPVDYCVGNTIVEHDGCGNPLATVKNCGSSGCTELNLECGPYACSAATCTSTCSGIDEPCHGSDDCCNGFLGACYAWRCTEGGGSSNCTSSDDCGPCEGDGSFICCPICVNGNCKMECY